MEDVSIAEAKEQLEDLVQRAARGEEVRITDPKLGSLRLVRVEQGYTMIREPFVPLAQDRVLGQLAGKMTVPARLMEPMSEDELRDWYGDDV